MAKNGKRLQRAHSLLKMYPPSEPCSCGVCLNYCVRPGWWTVSEAERAIAAGYADRMMLEISPEFSFGVLSPAFRGCEAAFASNRCSRSGCTFLHENLCELHGTGHQPIECRFCHHARTGRGAACHLDIERDWSGARGRALVRKWARMIRFVENLDPYNRQLLVAFYDKVCEIIL